MFCILREDSIIEIPVRNFAQIVTLVRQNNLGWRFLIDSIVKLAEVGETNEKFLVKSLSLFNGWLQYSIQAPDIPCFELLAQ